MAPPERERAGGNSDLSSRAFQSSRDFRPLRAADPAQKMYCFCTAEMPIRAILAISEDVTIPIEEPPQV